MSHPIQTYRQQKQWSQQELADFLVCSQTLVSLIEVGERSVSKDNAEGWEAKTGIPRLSLLYPDQYPYELAP